MPDPATALLRKIRAGEDSFLELKEVVFAGREIKGPRRDSLANEMAAFANARGGELVLGVSDTTREVTGIPLDRLDVAERYVVEIARDSVDPPLDVVTRRLGASGPRTTNSGSFLASWYRAVRSSTGARRGTSAVWEARSGRCVPRSLPVSSRFEAGPGSPDSTSNPWGAPRSTTWIRR